MNKIAVVLITLTLAACENVGDGAFDAQEQAIVRAVLDALEGAQ